MSYSGLRTEKTQDPKIWSPETFRA
jgi:hypothetical protein